MLILLSPNNYPTDICSTSKYIVSTCCASRKTRDVDDLTATILFLYVRPTPLFITGVTVRLRSAHTIDRRSGRAQANPDMYRHFVTVEYERHIAAMEQNGEWGTQVETEALSKGLERHIRVWRTNGQVSRGSTILRIATSITNSKVFPPLACLWVISVEAHASHF